MGKELGYKIDNLSIDLGLAVHRAKENGLSADDIANASLDSAAIEMCAGYTLINDPEFISMLTADLLRFGRQLIANRLQQIAGGN